jgi:hypothetical protein
MSAGNEESKKLFLLDGGFTGNLHLPAAKGGQQQGS